MGWFDGAEVLAGAERLRASLDAELDEWSARLVAAYLQRPDEFDGGFSGLLFDDLGVDQSDPNSYGLADLLALTTLDVHVPPKGLRQLLETERGYHEGLLAAIPTDVPLWGDDPALVGAALDAAAAAWDALLTVRGVGWVTAGKLLARKRPQLVPVYDQHIQKAFANPPQGESWNVLHVVLRDSGLREQIEQLRPDGAAYAHLSLLRLLDIALWMRRSQASTAQHARASLGVPDRST